MPKARHMLSCGVAAAAILSFGGTALAAETADPTDNEVQGVVVTGLEETQPLELSKEGHDLVIVTGKTIKDKSYVDLGNALQMEVPGLYLSQQAGPFSYAYLSLQGSRVQDVLWTIDGIRINNRLYSTTAPNDTLPASMIERIEVLKGGEGLFYGTQGVAGVINFVTRGFSDTLGGELNLGGDTNDSSHIDAFVRGGLNGHRYVLFGSRDKSDGFAAFDTFQPSGTDRERGYEVNTAGGKYGFDITDKLKFSASYIHTDASLDYPQPSLVTFSQNRRNEDIVGAKLDYAPDQGLQFYLKGYFHDWDSHYTTAENDPADLTAPPTVTEDNLFWGFQDAGVNALAKLPVGGVDYLVGYDHQSYKGRDEVLLIDQVSENVNAVFAQVRTNSTMSDRYSLGAGVRYNKTGGNQATVWTADGRFDITPTLFVQGNVGTSFSLPTAEQLFAVDPFSTFGNPSLKPEEGTNYNASIGGRLGGVEWLATGFRRDIDNLISFEDNAVDPVTGAFIPSPTIPDVIENDPNYSGEAYVNLGEAEFQGFELLASGPIGDSLRWSASYTQNEARQKGSAVQLDRIPKSLWKATLSWEPPGSRYGAAATALWTGDVYQTVNGAAATFQNLPPRNSANQVNYGDYYVLDLSGFVYLDEAHKHRLTLRLQNAFDEVYATRVSSQPTDSGVPARFVFRNLGAPRTLHIRYSYAFGG